MIESFVSTLDADSPSQLSLPHHRLIESSRHYRPKKGTKTQPLQQGLFREVDLLRFRSVLRRVCFDREHFLGRANVDRGDPRHSDYR